MNFRSSYILGYILKYLGKRWHSVWDLLQNNKGAEKWRKIEIKQNSPWVGNYWSWVISTWKFTIAFWLFYMLKFSIIHMSAERSGLWARTHAHTYKTGQLTEWALHMNQATHGLIIMSSLNSSGTLSKPLSLSRPQFPYLFKMEKLD